YVMQICHVVFGNDVIITHCCSLGNLELNQFAPVIVHFTLKSLKLLNKACLSLREYVLKIEANAERCEENLKRSTSNLTPLIKIFGYEEVSEVIRKTNWDFAKTLKILAEKHDMSYDELLKRLNLRKMTGLGYAL
ncbi:MAG: aspartate ammonia-lyase, partial [Thermotogaceae bacterium]|nr:aspartate ammonia-lyase [Thermotogaceae bacterium]